MSQSEGANCRRKTRVRSPPHLSCRAAAAMGAPEMTMGALGVERLFGVKDKTVLVTGGARGIGLMIAAGFVANGAKVYIASRSVEACEAAAKRLTAEGPGTCHALAADLGTESGCAALAAALKRHERALHVLAEPGLDVQRVGHHARGPGRDGFCVGLFFWSGFLFLFYEATCAAP